jgi:hypothetical protein
MRLPKPFLTPMLIVRHSVFQPLIRLSLFLLVLFLALNRHLTALRLLRSRD